MLNEGAESGLSSRVCQTIREKGILIKTFFKLAEKKESHFEESWQTIVGFFSISQKVQM